VWTSLPWSLEEWEQGNKRVSRQGQQHPVVIHVLLPNGTIDSTILDRLEGKTIVQNDLLAYLESPL
jgi:SNF2 family DNA or RNA helicase